MHVEETKRTIEALTTKLRSETEAEVREELAEVAARLLAELQTMRTSQAELEEELTASVDAGERLDFELEQVGDCC